MKQNNFFNILLIWGSGIVAGLLNYAYHPIMLQFLSLEEFGAFASLLWIINILGVFLVWIALFLNKQVASAGEDREKIGNIFRESMKYLGVLWVGLFILYLVASPFIGKFLRIDTLLVILAGVGLITGCMGTGIDGVLRGLKQFRFMSLMTILGAFSKLAFGLVLVLLALKNYGALGGIIASGVFTFSLSLIWCFRLLPPVSQQTQKYALFADFWKQRKEISNFVLVSFFFAFFMNIDVIFAKHLFPEDIAGIYAGVAVLGKFLVFLLLSIETVYYSEIMSYPKEDVALHHIRNPLVWIALTALIAIGVNILAGSFFLGILKKELVSYQTLYIWLLVYYSFLVYISFFAKILVAWGCYTTNFILWAFAILLTIFVFFEDTKDIEHFIASFVILGASLALTLWVLFWKNYSKNTKKSLQ